MDHKDFMDSVIAGMTETTDNAETPVENNFPNPDEEANSIRLELSTGDTFLVDPNTFDWGRAAENLGQMTANEAEFRRMAKNVINASHDTSPEAKLCADKFIKDTIDAVADYLSGYQIRINYREAYPGATDVEIALIMIFDANNITRTMVHHTMVFMLLSMEAKSSMDDENEYPDGFDYVPMYCVTVKFAEDDGEPTILSVEETDDWKPDEVGVVDDDGQDRYTVYIPASSPEEASEIALKSFKEGGDAESITELLVDEHLEHERYDAEDQYDNSDEDAIIEEGEDNNNETC